MSSIGDFTHFCEKCRKMILYNYHINCGDTDEKECECHDV